MPVYVYAGPFPEMEWPRPDPGVTGTEVRYTPLLLSADAPTLVKALSDARDEIRALSETVKALTLELSALRTKRRKAKR